MLPSYVLITPARNEVENLGKTISSMLAQSHVPKKWVIVSDGSTDGTDELVKKMTEGVGWIDLLRMPERKETHFAGKVNAFNKGLESVRSLTFDCVGNLDADLSFDPDHFEYLLGKMGEDKRLGVCGTPFVEQGVQTYDYRFTNIEHVSGACQIFRRECFEEIGGYIPIKFGGIDWVAVTTARMKGWKTRTFTDKHLEHHRPMGSSHAVGLRSWRRVGQKDYLFGNDPLWEVFRSFYQMAKRPIVLSGIFILLGFTESYAKGMQRPISNELLQFTRMEQRRRLKEKFLGRRAKGSA